MTEAKEYSVVMPRLGLSMVQAQLLEWTVKEGEYIKKGDHLFTLESEKSTLKIEAPASGYVHIVVQAGETVPVNTQVCVIISEPISEGELVALDDKDTQGSINGHIDMKDIKTQVAHPIQDLGKGKAAASPRARVLARELSIDMEGLRGTGPRGMIVAANVQKAIAQKPENEGIRATPVARRLAEEAGIDLRGMKGSGIIGEVTKMDIEKIIRAQSSKEVVQPTVELHKTVSPLIGLREIISNRLSSSWRERPHVTLTTEVNAEELISARRQVMEETGQKISYNAFFVLAAARALQEHPNVNISLTADGIVQHTDINIGLAVDTEKGLLVPVIRNADQKGLLEIEREIQELVERVLTGKSLPDDLSGSTFTITNLGAYGIEAFTPIINPPESAILGIGAIHPKAVVVNDQLTAQNRLMLSLSHDHRVLDGAPAARFLQRIAQLISRPLVLFAL